MGARWGTNHNGVDLAPNTPGDTNCKILSAGDGVVLQARSGVGGFGTWIVIKHKDDLYTIYGHMHPSTLKVKTGDTVKEGSILQIWVCKGSQRVSIYTLRFVQTLIIEKGQQKS